MTGTSGKLQPKAERRVVLRRPWAGGRVQRRLMSTLLVYAMLFGLVGWRLVDVQVRNADVYADRGASQRERIVELPSRRGRLYDRDGNVLATSVDAATIYMDPRVFNASVSESGLELPPAADREAAAAALAPLVGVSAEELAARFDTDKHFVYVGRQLDWQVGQDVLALGLPGVGVITEPRRVYPAGGLAGQLIGFTGIDGEGLTGLELVNDALLSGQAGTLGLERAPGGLSIASAVREIEPAVPGTDLVLTIDRDIQDAAQRAAANAVEEFNALSASVVVLEVGTGDVLAIASAPGYDPNVRLPGGEDTWRLKAVTDVFEPGSVQKAVTAAAALEEGIVTADTILMVPDNIRVGNKTFTDAHDHPVEEMSFAKIIETSSNVGTIMVAKELGQERLGGWLDKFGFGKLTGVGLPGESSGLVRPTQDWWSTSLPTIAIGQGIAMTLLQAANFYATIANDGVQVTPRVVRGTVGEDGRLTPAAAGASERKVSVATAESLQQILGSVVNGDNGTGARAAVPGFTVGGKTGTARKPLADGRGYSEKYIATFAGFAPVNNPRIVVAVMVDEPYPIWGGVVAAPTFASVMAAALLEFDVPPTDPQPALGDALMRALADADEKAKVEGPATSASDVTSPTAGMPAGAQGGQ